ncbi:MAG: PIG-L family deacetylase [Phenylobacterium sp.]|jgi:LmbE family N-acetylglucosaminyl deacetylase
MTLLARIAGRTRRATREITDIPLRRRLGSRPRAARSLASLSDLGTQPLLLVFAHPDDEVIAAGALMQRPPRVGLVTLTSGATRHGSYARRAGFDSWLDYGHARQMETEAALGWLGREVAPRRNLGLPDMGTMDELVAITRHLVGQLRQGVSYVVTHAYEGGHPDHDSAAFCVHAACALIGREGGRPPVIVEAPLYNEHDGAVVHSQFLPHEDAGAPVTFHLSADEQALKRRMYESYVTQRETMADFGVGTEIFREAPRYHFSCAPQNGGAAYDNYGWPIRSPSWRRSAWRAMRELDLTAELA